MDEIVKNAMNDLRDDLDLRIGNYGPDLQRKILEGVMDEISQRLAILNEELKQWVFND